MVITAVALVAMLGIATLVIDIGFTAGQRRFMQNGADAAALAAARKLADAVSPYPVNGPWPNGIPHYFDVSDATMRATATDLAQRNQNPGMTGRTTSFTVAVAYCVAANDSSYSTAAGCPSPNSWVTSPTVNGRVPDGTYKIRVTVSSTITTFIGGVIGRNTMTTNAQAIAVIRGVCPETVVTGNTLPFTLWDQQDFGTNPGQLFELWGTKNPPAPPGADSSWKNLIDFSPPSRWCDGVTADYTDWVSDPKMARLVPSGTSCTPNLKDPTKNFTGTGTDWNRGSYAPDARGGCYTGNSINPDDVATWASATYGGTLAVGMKLPIYPKTGDGGNNVSTALYGAQGPNPCSGTYFFNGATKIDPDQPTWGPYRDVVVFTYDTPAGQGGHYYDTKSATPTWTDTSQGNKMGRVTLVRVLHFRLYKTPPGVDASSVWGRVVSPVFPPGSNPPLCGSGPGIYGNVVGLGG